MFQFKQFSVDQTNCAMKINTDGVLLGALAEVETPGSILDIGTGTGVIALMLAQRFPDALIDAVEIDELAAVTASENFSRSAFSNRLKVFAVGFKEFFESNPEKKYELIVSNPPFYINSLLSPGEKKQLAKHADEDFFKEMLKHVAQHLTSNGQCWLILPTNTAMLVRTIGKLVGLNMVKTIYVSSFVDRLPHREIIVFSHQKLDYKEERFIIYDKANMHSAAYKSALREYFLNF